VLLGVWLALLRNRIRGYPDERLRCRLNLDEIQCEAACGMAEAGTEGSSGIIVVDRDGPKALDFGAFG